MTLESKSSFRLETLWTGATETERSIYVLTLTNFSSRPVAGFSLCLSGPARIDPATKIENGVLTMVLSNHAELRPPDGFVLTPGVSWRIVARGVSYPMQHWTEGATTAYLAFTDLTTAPIEVVPTHRAGDNAPLRDSTEIYPIPPVAPVPISVIPWPARVAISGRRVTPNGLILKGDGVEAAASLSTFSDLVIGLFPTEVLVQPTHEGGYPVDLMAEQGHGAEAYAIRFLSGGATLRATTRKGFLYGLITLGQILRGALQHPETFLFPAEGEITDQPVFGWRGTHLDVARQFYAAAEIEQFLCVLAWNKLNHFHWHLSDDEAWRVEIEAYPELTTVGAWRGHGLPIPPLLGSGAERSGGYYSKATIRALVAHADRLGIDIVPEIDMPGHCFAALQSLPWLKDPAEAGEYFSIQGFPNNCLNPGREETYRFLETMLAELLDLFPSRTIHVGGDEVPADAWTHSPQARTKLAELERKGVAELQASFMRRIQKFLTEHGRITGAWQEAAHGGGIDKAHCYLNGWRTVDANAKLAGEGYYIVVCPAQVYYLDMALSDEWVEPGVSWAGWSSVENTYRFDPLAGWSAAQKWHFLGVQSCIWSEPMTDRRVFNRLVFPRLSAVAETGWTDHKAKSWDRFKALVGMMPVLYGKP